MAFFKRNVCLTPLSKNGQGKMAVRKQNRTKCERLECVTLKVGYVMDIDLVSHDCDKLPGLDGRLSARLRMATDNDGQGRGFHFAKYQWTTQAGDVIVGRMRGITNAATHRECERCDKRGHLEGVLGGKIIEGKHKGCRVRASYVLDYDPGVEGQDSGNRMALEGVMVCPCKDKQ